MSLLRLRLATAYAPRNDKRGTMPRNDRRGLVPTLRIPRNVRYIDNKRKLAVIINPSYFGKFLNLTTIDKIDI